MYLFQKAICSPCGSILSGTRYFVLNACIDLSTFTRCRPDFYPMGGPEEHARCFSAVNTPNANMADHSVGAWNELHESEASQASVL